MKNVVALSFLVMVGCVGSPPATVIVSDAAVCGLKLTAPSFESTGHFDGCQVPAPDRSSAFIVYKDDSPVMWVEASTPTLGEFKTTDPDVFFGLSFQDGSGCVDWTGVLSAAAQPSQYWQFDFDVTCKKNGYHAVGALFGNVSGYYGRSAN